MEVDTPLLARFPSIDSYIDLFEVEMDFQEPGYLHSSPEYAMKRLLAANSGPIYQMSHVYRKGEVGALHNPVFTLVEWYQVESNQSAFLEEVFSFIELFLGKQEVYALSYQEAFMGELQTDPMRSSREELIQVGLDKGVDCGGASRQEVVNILWGTFVEKSFDRSVLTLVSDYPADQAALAQVVKKGEIEVAERFEIYWQGIELANGYHELGDFREQRRRFEKANRVRIENGKKALPRDPYFLSSLEKGLPDSYGVAVGFDRLLMLHLGLERVEQVLPFPWGSQ